MTTASAAESLRNAASADNTSEGIKQLIRDIGAASSSGAGGVTPYLVFSQLAEGGRGWMNVLCQVLAALSKYGGAVLPTIILALGFYQAVQSGSVLLTKALNIVGSLATFISPTLAPLVKKGMNWLGGRQNADELDAAIYDQVTDAATLGKLLTLCSPGLPVMFQMVLSEAFADAPANVAATNKPATPTYAQPGSAWNNLYTSLLSPAVPQRDGYDIDPREVAARTFDAAVSLGVTRDELTQAIGDSFNDA